MIIIITILEEVKKVKVITLARKSTAYGLNSVNHRVGSD